MPPDAPLETEKWNALGFHPSYKTTGKVWAMQWAYPMRGSVPRARHKEFWKAVELACQVVKKKLPDDFKLSNA